jgi:hypothetical protein
MNANGNTMTTKHFTDFYMLEALQAEISMAKAQNPDFHFRKSVIRLEEDVNAAFEHLSSTMAFRIYVYLWGAALGEAAYANENCEYQIAEMCNGFSYRDAFDYFPTDENVQVVMDTFEQDWNQGGYGGDAWAGIVHGMSLYGKITNAAFIDHAVDLEHNGGCVFDKTGVKPFLMDCNSGFPYGVLHQFLDHKFAHNILDTNFTHWRMDNYEVSWKVYNLIVRFSNIVRKVYAVDFLSPTLEWLSDYTVEWEEEAYTNTFSWIEANGGMKCEECGCSINEDDANYLEGYDGYFCDDCIEKCDECGEYVHKNDTQWMDGEDSTWCDDCANQYKTTCDDCGHDIHVDHSSMTEDDYTLCESCAEEHKCDECDKLYFDVNYHTEHEHKEEEDEIAPLPFDSDGVFENVDNFEFNITHKQFEYCMFVIQTKEVRIHNREPKTATGYQVGDLFVLKQENEYIILTPFELWFKPKNATWFNAIQLANKAKDKLDWASIKDEHDWANFAQENDSIITELRELTQEAG